VKVLNYSSFPCTVDYLTLELLLSSLRLKWKPAKKGIMTREAKQQPFFDFSKRSISMQHWHRSEVVSQKSLQFLLFQLLVVVSQKKK
jgi:hypothetical protein